MDGNPARVGMILFVLSWVTRLSHLLRLALVTRADRVPHLGTGDLQSEHTVPCMLFKPPRFVLWDQHFDVRCVLYPFFFARKAGPTQASKVEQSLFKELAPKS